jgi:hypothetical protein
MEDRFSPDVVDKLEQRYEELHLRLLGAAVSMGRDSSIVLEFDPSVDTASMTLEEPRVFKVGPDFLLNRSTEDLITISQHEGCHADISRVGSGSFFKSEKLRALLNVGEDLRVNARAMDRAPGRKETYHDFFRRYYWGKYNELSTDEIPNLLPHEAFLQGIMSREYGETSPWDDDPIVGEAINEAWVGVQGAKTSRPVENMPDEMTVQQHFAQFEEILKQEVLPIYERLYEESLKQVEQGLKDGTMQSGQGRSTIDPNDLSAEAKKILEERAKKIADAHAPLEDLGKQQQRAREIFGEDKDTQEGEGQPGKSKYAPGSLGDLLQNRHDDHRRRQEALKGKTYSQHLAALGDLPSRVFTVLDGLLKPNTDFEFEGHFTSGPRVDVERAIKAIHGLLTNLRVFERKVEPTGNDYRFSLLTDCSGSMADDGPREAGGLGLCGMFVDVFERLGLPYGLDAFHNGYIPLKGFETSLKTVQERNDFFNFLRLNIWGGGSTNIREGIQGSIERVQNERRINPREQDIVFVLTDGEENVGDGPAIRALCEEAAKEGIIVVGIGIGEGMEMVRQHFPIYLVENNPLNLPQLLAEFIKEYVKIQEEEW